MWASPVRAAFGALDIVVKNAGYAWDGRVHSMREAADAIFWLCSPLSDYVTGQMIPVNGGARGGMS
jgi:NAD(P)-dependent dehydrogenase (short-subunit alcohol dehydrogenase family)